MTANVTFVYAEKADVLRVANAALRFRPTPGLLARVHREHGARSAWLHHKQTAYREGEEAPVGRWRMVGTGLLCAWILWQFQDGRGGPLGAPIMIFGAWETRKECVEARQEILKHRSDLAPATVICLPSDFYPRH